MIIFFNNFLIYIIFIVFFYHLIQKIFENLPLIMDRSIKGKFHKFKNNPKLINQAIYNLIENNLINELNRRKNIEKVKHQVHPYKNQIDFYNKIDENRLLAYAKSLDNQEIFYMNNAELDEIPQLAHYNLTYSEFLSLLFLFDNYNEKQYFLLKYKNKNFNIFYVNRDGFNNVKHNILFKISYFILNDTNLHFNLDSFEFNEFLERNKLNEYKF